VYRQAFGRSHLRRTTTREKHSYPRDAVDALGFNEEIEDFYVLGVDIKLELKYQENLYNYTPGSSLVDRITRGILQNKQRMAIHGGIPYSFQKQRDRERERDNEQQLSRQEINSLRSAFTTWVQQGQGVFQGSHTLTAWAIQHKSELPLYAAQLKGAAHTARCKRDEYDIDVIRDLEQKLSIVTSLLPSAS
jgi:hypothetical protein